MIKFFRKIRQNLLNKGKTSKYLTYVIGEIILVVIGILIALHINNWNIERQNKNEEQSYLKAIKTNLTKDLLNLESLVNRMGIQIIRLEKLKNELNSDSTDIKQNEQFTNSLLTTFSFVPEKATIDDLKSSGKLNLLANKQIKDTLLSYYNFIDTGILAKHTSLNNYSRNIIAPILMTHYALEYGYPESMITENSKLLSLNPEQKQDQFLNNAIKYRAALLSSLKLNYEDLMSAINRLQESLEKEIEK
jgi:hypothetical protein